MKRRLASLTKKKGAPLSVEKGKRERVSRIESLGRVEGADSALGLNKKEKTPPPLNADTREYLSLSCSQKDDFFLESGKSDFHYL